MRIPLMLGLCLSNSLALSIVPVHAEIDKTELEIKSAQAARVYIDEETGRKIPFDDKDVGDTDVGEVVPAETLSRMNAANNPIPAESGAPEYHADGSISVQLGAEHMKFFVVEIGKDGTRVMTHQSAEEIRSGFKVPTSKPMEK